MVDWRLDPRRPGVFPAGRPQSAAGVVTVLRRVGSEEASERLKLRDFNAEASYTFKVWLGALERGAPDMLAGVQPLPGTAPVLGEDDLRMSGRRLPEDGLLVKLPGCPQAAGIRYQRTGDGQ